LEFAKYSFVECGVAKGGCLAMMKYCSGTNNKIFDYLKGKSYFDNKIDASKNNKGAYGQSTPAFKKAYDQIYGIYPALKKELKAAGYTGQTPINDFIKDHKATLSQQDKPKFEWFMENVVSKHFTLKRIFNS
jgi:hypothetical protein